MHGSVPMSRQNGSWNDGKCVLLLPRTYTHQTGSVFFSVLIWIFHICKLAEFRSRVFYEPKMRSFACGLPIMMFKPWSLIQFNNSTTWIVLGLETIWEDQVLSRELQNKHSWLWLGDWKQLRCGQSCASPWAGGPPCSSSNLNPKKYPQISAF